MSRDDCFRVYSKVPGGGFRQGMKVKRSSHIEVAAAIVRAGPRFLLTLRPEGKAHAGYWEFPGGKIEPGESPAEALRRELREEVGVEVARIKPWRRIEHRYPDKIVDLHFLEAAIVSGEPLALEVADLGWFLPEEMPDLPILPADLGIVAILKASFGESLRHD